MSRILVVYSTNSGSTGEIAETIAAELTAGGHAVEVKKTSDVNEIDPFDAIVVGAPMILGWQNQARRFLKRHQVKLASKKVALFASAMRLTLVPQEALPMAPLVLDPNLVTAPQKPGALSLKERFTTCGHYLKPMLQSMPNTTPVSVAFFNGKLEMYRLKVWQAAFVMAVVRAVPGDYRDWDFIRAWGKSLSEIF